MIASVSQLLAYTTQPVYILQWCNTPSTTFQVVRKPLPELRSAWRADRSARAGSTRREPTHERCYLSPIPLAYGLDQHLISFSL